MRLREEIGNKLFHLRIENNLTQEEAAKRAGIGLRTLQNVEKGAFNFRIDTIEKILKVYHVILKLEKE